MEDWLGFLLVALFFVLRAVFKRKTQEKRKEEEVAIKPQPTPKVSLPPTIFSSPFADSLSSSSQEKTPILKKRSPFHLFSDRSSLRKAFILSEILKRKNEH
jgi:hypothetical protein